MRLSGLSTLAIGLAGASSGSTSDLERTVTASTIEPPADVTITIAPVTVELAPNLVVQHDRLQRHRLPVRFCGCAKAFRRSSTSSTTPTCPSSCTGTASVCLRSSTAPTRRARRRCRRAAGGAITSRRRRPARAGITPTRWRWPISIAAATRDSSAFSSIEGRHDPGAYDQEIFLALRDWEPYFTTQMTDMDALGPRWPQPERPDVADIRPNGLEVSAAFYSINDKALGAR